LFYQFKQDRCKQLIKYLKNCDNLRLFENFIAVVCGFDDDLYVVACDIMFEYFVIGLYDREFVKAVINDNNLLDSDNIQTYLKAMKSAQTAETYDEYLQIYGNMLVANSAVNSDMKDLLEVGFE